MNWAGFKVAWVWCRGLEICSEYKDLFSVFIYGNNETRHHAKITLKSVWKIIKRW